MGSKTPASVDDLRKLPELRAQSMSYREITQTMDTSYNTVRRLLGKC